jgi:predicted RecB family nuclease
MYRNEHGLVVSPTDLCNYLESPFASWLDRWKTESEWADSHPATVAVPEPPRLELCRPDEEDEMLVLVAQHGLAHEQRVLEKLRAENREMVEIDRKGDAEVLTREAMARGVDTIFQGRLKDGIWAGWTDFLIKVDGVSDFGPYAYEVWDTKLARSAKPHHIVQLCAYVEMLETVQGTRSDHFTVVLGTGEHRVFPTQDYFYYYQRLKRSFQQFHNQFSQDGVPDPAEFANHGRWSSYAQAVLEKRDHLSRVAFITQNQISKLESAGCRTLLDLASTELSRVPRLTDAVYHRLRGQAQVQLASVGLERPVFRLQDLDPARPQRGLTLLPPFSPNDVFFDIEGYPLAERGLEYLLGAVLLDGEQRVVRTWWSHDQAEERDSFEAFIDWTYSRWQTDRSLHVYHYAPYEVTAMKRLMGKHGTREDQVDDLLRNHVFVDLYKVLRQAMLVGTPTYSLKDIERLYRPVRGGEVTTSMGSVVAYEQWLESGNDPDSRNQDILDEIADYNEDDCDSLVDLAGWLRSQQEDSGIAYLPTGRAEDAQAGDATPDPEPQETPKDVLRRNLQTEFRAVHDSDIDRADRLDLLSHLMDFHWREAKPKFWLMFARSEMTHDELVDDLDCLGDLRQSAEPPCPDKQSFIYTYRFDTDQDTKLDSGDRCFYGHDLGTRITLQNVDTHIGEVEFKLGKRREKPPTHLSLIPEEFIDASVISNAVARYAQSVLDGASESKAVDDLLARRTPELLPGPSVAEVPADHDLVGHAVDLVGRLDASTLCIQGPPGTGKTYTAAAVIEALTREGKHVAVTANSHKVILNILAAVHRRGVPARVIKVGRADPRDLANGGIEHVPMAGDAVSELGSGPVVMGATAWVLCREEMREKFDVLLIDEAGQFSLANVVGCGLCAKNLVLVGDQMQLAQPIQGVHPGDSGLSGLDYLLNGRATIPPDFGLFLDTTWRMHPSICTFISEAVYDGRLQAHPDNQNQSLSSVRDDPQNLPNHGIVRLNVHHTGNTQGADEEVELIDGLVQRLIGRTFTDRENKTRTIDWDDVLLVAPYNMQVRKLQRKLGDQARVGSVDRFQGQEAPVVIVSMASSSIDDAPRGAQFLLNPNRLNVAVSRAQALAIVVGSPLLAEIRCQNLDEIRLVNLLCRLDAYAAMLAGEVIEKTQTQS